jgi:hypothetical protein
MATRTEANTVYAAGLIQGIALVTFPAASTIFTDPSSFAEEQLVAMGAAVAGGVIAFYQLGYGIAAFGTGPLVDAGVGLPKLFGFAAIAAVIMGGLSFALARKRPVAAVTPSPRQPERSA